MLPTIVFFLSLFISILNVHVIISSIVDTNNKEMTDFILFMNIFLWVVGSASWSFLFYLLH